MPGRRVIDHCRLPRQWEHRLRSILGFMKRNRLELLKQDIRIAFRMMRRNPSVSIIAVMTLALAIGADTAMFSVVDALLLRPLPIREPDRVIVVHNRLPKLNLMKAGVSPVQFRDYGSHAD